MSQVDARRLAAFRRRFPEREELPLEQLYAHYFGESGVGVTECIEVLELLAEELAIPAGMLRPEDRMAEILEPVHGGNPLRWIEEWTRAADGKAELNDQVRRRLETHGTLDQWGDIATVGDLVRAWCGKPPGRLPDA